jgi:hypothetical protein
LLSGVPAEQIQITHILLVAKAQLIPRALCRTPVQVGCQRVDIELLGPRGELVLGGTPGNTHEPSQPRSVVAELDSRFPGVSHKVSRQVGCQIETVLRVSEKHRQVGTDRLSQREVVPLLELVLADAVVSHRCGEEGYRAAEVHGIRRLRQTQSCCDDERCQGLKLRTHAAFFRHQALPTGSPSMRPGPFAPPFLLCKVLTAVMMSSRASNVTAPMGSGRRDLGVGFKLPNRSVVSARSESKAKKNPGSRPRVFDGKLVSASLLLRIGRTAAFPLIDIELVLRVALVAERALIDILV